MKKIALITTNKIFAESFELAIKSNLNLEFELVLLLNPDQALLDAEVLEIDIALIHIRNSSLKEKNSSLELCENIYKKLPDSNILLLISEEDIESQEIASRAKKNKIIDDYMFFDNSLKYLFAKIAAL